MKMEIDDIAREATRKERLYDQAESKSNKLYLLNSLKDKIGTNYNATIQMIFGDNLVVKTEDGMPSAHFEHTIVVTKDGYEILTGEWEK